MSLGAIVLILGVTTVASLVKSAHDRSKQAADRLLRARFPSPRGQLAALGGASQR